MDCLTSLNGGFLELMPDSVLMGGYFRVHGPGEADDDSLAAVIWREDLFLSYIKIHTHTSNICIYHTYSSVFFLQYGKLLVFS